MASTPSMSTRWTQERARIASLTRSRRPDDPELLAARERMAALKVEADIAKLVAKAPPLTAAQRDRLVTIIRGGASA